MPPGNYPQFDPDNYMPKQLSKQDALKYMCELLRAVEKFRTQCLQTDRFDDNWTQNQYQVFNELEGKVVGLPFHIRFAKRRLEDAGW